MRNAGRVQELPELPNRGGAQGGELGRMEESRGEAVGIVPRLSSVSCTIAAAAATVTTATPGSVGGADLVVFASQVQVMESTVSLDARGL